MTGPQVQLRSGLFVCVEDLRPSQQLRSCRAAGQLPINTVPGQAGPPGSFVGLNYRKTGNFRVVKFSRNFAVSINPRKLKSAKYFPIFEN